MVAVNIDIQNNGNKSHDVCIDRGSVYNVVQQIGCGVLGMFRPVLRIF